MSSAVARAGPARLRPEEVEVVIYHRNCTDGFASAHCAHDFARRERARGREQTIEFLPGIPGRPPPSAEVRGKNVLICDLSYGAAAMAELASAARKVLVLDHHQSALEDLAALPAHMKVLDLGRSGATLAWDYFNPGAPVPRALRYVEDHDLWAHRLPETESFAAFAKSLPFTFEAYDRLLDEAYLEGVVFPRGRGMAELVQSMARGLARRAVPKFAQMGGRCLFVAYLNSPVLQSELGHEVLALYPSADFSAIYSVNDHSGETRFSLRSDDTAADVSAIARTCGGGGHRNASGCILASLKSTLPGRILGGRAVYRLLEGLELYRTAVDDGPPILVAALRAPWLQRELAQHLADSRYSGVLEAAHHAAVLECQRAGSRGAQGYAAALGPNPELVVVWDAPASAGIACAGPALPRAAPALGKLCGASRRGPALFEGRLSRGLGRPPLWPGE